MKHFDTRLRRLEAQTPAPDWTVGEGLSSLLKAFKAAADGAAEEPLALDPRGGGLPRLLAEARALRDAPPSPPKD
jgi:hypothetical protein